MCWYLKRWFIALLWLGHGSCCWAQSLPNASSDDPSKKKHKKKSDETPNWIGTGIYDMYVLILQLKILFVIFGSSLA